MLADITMTDSPGELPQDSSCPPRTTPSCSLERRSIPSSNECRPDDNNRNTTKCCCCPPTNCLCPLSSGSSSPDLKMPDYNDLAFLDLDSAELFTRCGTNTCPSPPCRALSLLAQHGSKALRPLFRHKKNGTQGGIFTVSGRGNDYGTDSDSDTSTSFPPFSVSSDNHPQTPGHHRQHSGVIVKTTVPERSANEAATLSFLRSSLPDLPVIPECYGTCLGLTDTDAASGRDRWIVMERVRGAPLSEAWDELPPAGRRKIAARVAEVTRRWRELEMPKGAEEEMLKGQKAKGKKAKERKPKGDANSNSRGAKGGLASVTGGPVDALCLFDFMDRRCIYGEPEGSSSNDGEEDKKESTNAAAADDDDNSIVTDRYDSDDQDSNEPPHPPHSPPPPPQRHGPFPDEKTFWRALEKPMIKYRWPKPYRELVQRTMPACEPWTFSHGDLNMGNIMVRGDELAGIIDFEMAGFYPRWFEYASLQVPLGGPFEGPVGSVTRREDPRERAWKGLLREEMRGAGQQCEDDVGVDIQGGLWYKMAMALPRSVERSWARYRSKWKGLMTPEMLEEEFWEVVQETKRDERGRQRKRGQKGTGREKRKRLSDGQRKRKRKATATDGEEQTGIMKRRKA